MQSFVTGGLYDRAHCMCCSMYKYMMHHVLYAHMYVLHYMYVYMYIRVRDIHLYMRMYYITCIHVRVRDVHTYCMYVNLSPYFRGTFGAIRGECSKYRRSQVHSLWTHL